MCKIYYIFTAFLGFGLQIVVSISCKNLINCLRFLTLMVNINSSSNIFSDMKWKFAVVEWSIIKCTSIVVFLPHNSLTMFDLMLLFLNFFLIVLQIILLVLLLVSVEKNTLAHSEKLIIAIGVPFCCIATLIGRLGVC